MRGVGLGSAVSECGVGTPDKVLARGGWEGLWAMGRRKRGKRGNQYLLQIFPEPDASSHTHIMPLTAPWQERHCAILQAVTKLLTKLSGKRLWERKPFKHT